jgi:hypothetical protein
MYVDRHPLALNLDIDRVRDMLGQWRLRSSAGGVLARAIALAGARTHLVADHDVVIPQYLGRLEFVSQLSDLAADVGARFHELVLMDSKESSVARGAGRATDAELALMYDRLLVVIAARPSADVVWTRAGRVSDAYRDLIAVLSGGSAE